MTDLVLQGSWAEPSASDPVELSTWTATNTILDHLRGGMVRPILVPNWVPDQLPEWRTLREAYDYAAAARLPFDRLALDFGPGMAVLAGTQTATMTAAIIDRVGGALRINPTICTSDGAVSGVIPTLWGPDSRGVPGTVAIDPDGMTVSYPHEEDVKAGGPMNDLGRWATVMAAACIATLRLIESLNITLELIGVTRQLRRNHRGTLCVPQLITIETRESAPDVNVGAGYSRLTLRHQVRGHFKHYRPGTRIFEANPTARTLDPQRGEVVRVWCPPYLAGPDHAPLRTQVWKLPGYAETTC